MPNISYTGFVGFWDFYIIGVGFFSPEKNNRLDDTLSYKLFKK